MKSILIVDDDPELRSNISEILQDAGYQTDTANDGAEALTKDIGNFDVILLDLVMPGMSGMDVLTELKKRTPNAKIIMITAFATVDNAVAAIKRGAHDYIAKPFKIEELLIAVKMALEESRFEEGVHQMDLDYTLSSLANPLRRKIIHLLKASKGMRLMELTRELGVDDHTKVVFHLRTLRESDIILQNKKKVYSLTQEGERLLDCLNILENYLIS